MNGWAQKFGYCLIVEYLIVSALFGVGNNWKKAIYFVACALKDLVVLLL